jgi:hypothetical protein
MTSDELRFARRILGWVLTAQRILSMPELQEALAINIGVADFNVQDVTSSEDIISTCGGFVDHDQRSDLVTFSHAAVSSFLKNDALISHSDLCRTCLTYLQLAEFELHAQEALDDSLFESLFEPTEREARKEKFKFSNYAAEFWATHASHASQSERNLEIGKAILETFGSSGRREALEQLSHSYYVAGKSFLHVLVENRMAFIFIRPLSREEAFQATHAAFSQVD